MDTKVKDELKTILQFIEYQINEDKCTDDQIESWHKILSDNLKVDATISNISNFYGQSESNVRNVISRRMVEKPKRLVLYNWFKFTKIMPDSWKNRKP